MKSLHCTACIAPHSLHGWNQFTDTVTYPDVRRDMMSTWWVHDEYMMWRVHTSSTSSLDVAWRASWTQPRFFSGGICFHIAKAALAWHRDRGPDSLRLHVSAFWCCWKMIVKYCKHNEDNEDNEDTVTVLANCISTPQISSYPVVARTRKTETP